ncbi:DNA repair exonuclease [Paenibacillus sp. N1-5-1-14]|uniref:metallophosphoesterase family protein n=1 Tax=Paenibacillus radicibacter TaxID=2972488 RepID=UPI002158A4FF|nr:DNA repair exonuclease [Paenibacillus radicibacter]MCR8643916.1 DNA repair exonuclease [Paenibacillus radicibacter]
MQSFRFIHSADLHLDSPFRGMTRVPEAIRDRLRESTFHAFQELVHLAIREKVDFVLISGDVYDAADRSLKAQIRMQKGVQALADQGIEVFIIHGNHDPLDGRAAKLTWPEGVRIFPTDEVGVFPVRKPDRGVIAYVHGISYPTAAVTTNLSVKYKPFSSNERVYQIAMLHTNVDGASDHDNYAPCTKRELIDSGFDYWALGHIHTRQELHVEGQPPIVYPGNIQGRSIRETGVKGCYIVDVNESTQTSLTFYPLDRIRWEGVKLSIAGMDSEQELKDALEEKLEELRVSQDGRSTIVRVYLEGRGVLHDQLRKGQALGELLEELRAEELRNYLTDHEQDTYIEDRMRVLADSFDTAFVWIESIIDQTVRELDIDTWLTQPNLIGDLLRESRQLQRSEVELRAFVGEALMNLTSQSSLGKFVIPDREEELLQLLQDAESMVMDYLTDGGWEG